MEETIMDVTEEITETIVEPEIAEIAEGIDWAKCGIAVAGVALVAAGACIGYGAYQLAPKAAKRVKTWKADRAARKQAKKDKDTFGTDYVQINDVDENEDEN